MGCITGYFGIFYYYLYIFNQQMKPVLRIVYFFFLETYYPGVKI